MVIYVDVDDTLIRSFGTTRLPISPVIDQIRRLSANGATMYLWSSRGAQYAHETAIELEIERCFVGFLPKPDCYIDDQQVHAWPHCTHVLPARADTIILPPGDPGRR